MTAAGPHVGDTLPAAERFDAVLDLLRDGAR